MTKPLCLLIACLTLPLFAESPYDPSWSGIAPKRIVPFTEGDGEALVKAVAALAPGDRLEIAAGTYRVDRLWDIRASGTAEAPVWIVAAEGAQVVITRSDDRQNVVNVAQGGPVSYLCLRGLEITGGSHGLRLGQCEEVWVDQCHIHHNGGPNLTANSANSRKLFLTRNHLHHGGGHGEGMYLGGNDASVIMSESIVALNHVHDCGGSQGDGIEVKQGSWGNLIAENHVHDTQYPCITVYGTGGKAVNVIERNRCYRSGDHVMQVQGEAIVRNNLLISAKGSGFHSTDHQGKTTRLEVIHNTIVNTGHAFSGGSWNGREGMVLANNLIYSRDGNALHFANGSEGVTITGNVLLGSGDKRGNTKGRGLAEDLPGISWDATSSEGKPAPDAPVAVADERYLLPADFEGKPRTGPVSGAFAR
ncbi:MAG: right-handed parallel beta-helix repeat-containing protein [Verrucomicrobia bacterium]|nr:right-handed parallel beta-helix repeat-containing protein [Verrucomicrobiota bacterium]